MFALCLLAFAATAGVAHATAGTWGERAHFNCRSAPEKGQVDGLKNLEARFAAAPDGSYFVAEPAKKKRAG